MRDVCIKTTTSENHKRKNLSIIEIINQDGFVARAEKKFAYYVSEQSALENPEKMKNWMEDSPPEYHKKERHVSIRKMVDPATGVGQMMYRVTGSFYIVQDLHIFAVVFLHSIKFDLLSSRPTSLA